MHLAQAFATYLLTIPKENIDMHTRKECRNSILFVMITHFFLSYFLYLSVSLFLSCTNKRRITNNVFYDMIIK